jgi:hypothetical protein
MAHPENISIGVFIDGGYYDSIGKLEKAVGAGKNQLRNRYNNYKRNQKIERSIKKNADC